MTRGSRLLLTIAAAALATAGLAGLAGCAGPPGAASSVGQSPARSPTPIPTIPTGTGVISRTTLESCGTIGTNVTATGTVIMPKNLKGHVVVSVSWVNSATSSVYGRGLTTVHGKAGQKKEWSITAALPEKAESVSCVLGAVVP